MSNRDERPETMTDLAKRWLKANFRFHGDPMKSRRDREESREIEGRMHQKAQEDVVNTVANALMPDSWKRKLGDLERMKEERQREDEARRRAEHEALPRADVRMILSGDATGTLEQPIPVIASWPADAGAALTFELSPLEPIPVGNSVLQNLFFAVPNYAGPGAYDLSAMAHRSGDDWDPLWFMMSLDSIDEPFYWISDFGPASVTVEPDERTVRIRMQMQDAGSRNVHVDATLTMPEAVVRDLEPEYPSDMYDEDDIDDSEP